MITAVLASCGGGSSATPCTVDSECALGAVCRGNTCMTGCNDERDCPQDKPICDRDGSGGCVACVDDRDCPVPGLTCIAGECRLTCSGDADCNGGLCDPATHSCVACAENSDCALGHLCLDGACVAGCERDRDCPPETNACAADDGDHGTCYECIDSCASGLTCKDHHCTSQCTTNVQCPDGVCDTATGTCVQCLDDSPCALGTICDEQMCVAGCRADKDCPAATPKCDPTMGAHGTCVVAPGGGGGENAACTASSECQAGLRCMVLGICLKTCTTTCPAPQACTPFQDIEGNPLSFCL
jgi:hypothetical protein